MKKTIGIIIVSFLLAFPIAALAFAIASAATIAQASTMPLMPRSCTTPQTMATWYAAVAKHNLLISHNPADCKAQLISLGATPSAAGRECAK